MSTARKEMYYAMNNFTTSPVLNINYKHAGLRHMRGRRESTVYADANYFIFM